MTGMRRLLGGIVAMVCVGVVTGCASDPAPTAADYRTQIGSVCRDLRRSTAALPRPAPIAGAEIVRVGRRALALQREALGRIRSVTVPSTLEQTVRRWLHLVDVALEAGAASLAAQAQGDLAAARAANARGNNATARADELARRLRLDACASPVTG